MKQFVRSMFIQTEQTPNPKSLKFLPGTSVLPAEFGIGMDFRKGDKATNSPLAKTLMRINGVEGVYLGNDFITVSKADSVTWAQLKPDVFGACMDFFAMETPAVTEAIVTEAANDNEESEIVVLIKELLEERISPMVQEDGGDIVFVSFDEESGVVTVKLQGSCAGCPSSSVTLKSGVENMLMHYIPEITRVDALEEGAIADDPTERGLHFNPQTV